MRILAVFLLCVGLSLTAALAAETGCNTPEETPFDCKPEPQQGLDQCYRKALDRSEQALDEAYQAVVDRLQETPGAVLKLRLARETWKVYRDAECLFSASKVEDGSQYPMTLDRCKVRHNLAQECKLKKHFLSCEEGDTLCPVPLPR